MVLGEILNKNILFSGNYKYLTDAFFSDFYRRTISQKNYIEGLGYFIDFNEILRRKSESIRTPSIGIPDKDLFRSPKKSFYIEPNALQRTGNIVSGMALGSLGDYVRVHTPNLFSTTDDGTFIYENPYLYIEDGNSDTSLEEFKKDKEMFQKE